MGSAAAVPADHADGMEPAICFAHMCNTATLLPSVRGWCTLSIPSIVRVFLVIIKALPDSRWDLSVSCHCFDNGSSNAPVLKKGILLSLPSLRPSWFFALGMASYL